MNKKSLFRKIITILNVGRRHKFGKNISVDEAINIQNTYTSSVCRDDKLPDAPYVEIAKQLNSPKKEVFDAALYYLHRIAVNEPKNRQRITDLLESICRESKMSAADKSLVLQTVENIKNS